MMPSKVKALYLGIVVSVGVVILLAREYQSKDNPYYYCEEHLNAEDLEEHGIFIPADKKIDAYDEQDNGNEDDRLGCFGGSKLSDQLSEAGSFIYWSSISA